MTHPHRNRYTAAVVFMALSLWCRSALAGTPVEGSWVMDPEASDDIEARLALWLDTARSSGAGGGGGSRDGSRRAGGAKGGSRGGGGGGGRGGGMGGLEQGSTPSDGGPSMDPESIRGLVRGSQRIELNIQGDTMHLSRDGAEPLVLGIGERALRVDLPGGGWARMKSWWEDEVLLLRRRGPDGARIMEVFLPAEETDTLYVVVELESSHLGGTLAFRRVYRAVPKAETPGSECAVLDRGE